MLLYVTGLRMNQVGTPAVLPCGNGSPFVTHMSAAVCGGMRLWHKLSLGGMLRSAVAWAPLLPLVRRLSV